MESFIIFLVMFATIISPSLVVGVSCRGFPSHCMIWPAILNATHRKRYAQAGG